MFISAGHSNRDPGATAFGRKEADIAEETRNIVSFYLSKNGVAHEVDGRGDVNMELRDAVKRMKLHNLGVEFHCNASEQMTATGVEVLCHRKDDIIAGRICKAIADVLGIRNRGVKAENSGQHHRLAFVQAGGMIVELFFLSNPTDLLAYDQRKWLMGRAIAEILAGSGR